MNFDKSDLETMLEAWKIDPHAQELLSRLGSDYDEDGIPYWDKVGEEPNKKGGKMIKNPKTTAILEHTNIKLKNTHTRDKCKGEYCTIHKRSNHSMREFPQHWRGDRGIMERICTHGVGHVDPDEITDDRTHGCDGCCEPFAPKDAEVKSKSQIRRIEKELG